MCFIMVMTLPRLALSTASASAPPGAAPFAAHPTLAPLPIVPIDIATEAPVVEEVLAAEPAAEEPVEEALLAVVEGVPVETQAVSPPVENAVVDAAIPAVAPPAATTPSTAPVAFPTLEEFAATLANGSAQQVVGYYAPGLSALPVRQQPTGDGDYISDEYGTVTQYWKPSTHGVVGLLAHNTLSGREFFYLGQNQDIFLIYGDGRTQRYRVQRIEQYQALSPYDTRSDFVDLADPSAPVLSHSQVFQRVYTDDGTLVLQTCIEANGEPTWGRLFVIAEPI